MRKLKLQMVITLDGFLTAVQGGSFNWDSQVYDFCIDNLKNVDCILLSRIMAKDFIPHWAGVANNPKDSDYKIGKPLTDIPKIIFSNKLETNEWDNATLIKGDITEQINKLKKKKGKDIIMYGGYSFVSALIQHQLIDEYYLLLNPVVVGNGQSILNKLENDLQLTLFKCKSFDCGTVLLCYKPKRS